MSNTLTVTCPDELNEVLASMRANGESIILKNVSAKPEVEALGLDRLKLRFFIDVWLDANPKPRGQNAAEMKGLIKRQKEHIAYLESILEDAQVSYVQFG